MKLKTELIMENKTKQQQAGSREYPGVAQNNKCNAGATRKEVKADTKSLNNNPRNSDEQMP